MTTELRQQIARMIDMNFSYQQVADELGVTRSKVAGQLKRMRDQGKMPKSERGYTSVIPITPAPLTLPEVNKGPQPLPPPGIMTPPKRILSLMNHTDSHCKMPMDNGFWCGSPRTAGRQYCGFHDQGLYRK